MFFYAVYVRFKLRNDSNSFILARQPNLERSD